MQRALDQAPDQLTARQRRVSVSADIAQGIKGTVDIREYDTLAIDRDKFHLARCQVAGIADGNKAFCNCAHLEDGRSPGLFPLRGEEARGWRPVS